ARDGHGARDLPVDHRVPWRAAVGGERRTARRDVRLHPPYRNGTGVMTRDDHIVFIVDDDARIREAVGELLAAHGMRAIGFGSAGAYVGADKPDLPSCLVLDVELPDINGLD